ncbi:MAG: hypothetical protein DI585_06165 [Pseudomonas fluorescens]|nr:MAG: hypothetical protein DI585_06165 [Pseudomonas fluorescens]
MPKSMPRFPILTYEQLMSDGYFKAFPDIDAVPELPAEFHAMAALLMGYHFSDDITVVDLPDGSGIVMTEHHVRGRAYTLRWSDAVADRQMRRAAVIVGMSSPVQSQAVPVATRQVMLAWMLTSWFGVAEIVPAPAPLQKAS